MPHTYFDSKQRLVEHALEQLASDTLHRTSEIEIASRHDLADLILLALPTSEEGHTEWRTWIALWSECARGNSAAVALNESFDARWMDVLSSACTALGNSDPSTAAGRLAMAINGAGIDVCLNPSKWPPEELAGLSSELAQSV